jgi:protein phosphatase
MVATIQLAGPRSPLDRVGGRRLYLDAGTGGQRHVKILIVSDIHGNYDALSALPEGYDKLWVLGDLVNYGPEPAEVTEWVRKRAAIVVRGNHDHAAGFGVDPRCSAPYRAMASATQRFTESVLSREQKEFLANLPLMATAEAGDALFLLCHAKPSDPLFGYCPPESEQWPTEVGRLLADVVLVGHTHLPFVRRVGNCTIVNPGSLGQPKTGGSEASYAVWNDGAIELKLFSYPFERTISKIGDLPIPDGIRQDLASVLRTGGTF